MAEKLHKSWTRESTTLRSPASSSLPAYSPSQTAIMEPAETPWWQNVIDGFRRDPYARTLPINGIAGGGRGTPTSAHAQRGPLLGGLVNKSVDNGQWPREYDTQTAANNTANSPLLRQLRGRHLQMIAIGGSIGTGLFVSSGSALSVGGPASLLISFGLIGIMIYCTVHALGEMAVRFPIAGSFAAYSTRFLDPAWGFAMGWNYAVQWLVAFPLEVVAATITLEFWNPGINHDAFVVIFLVLVTSINFFGVKGYGDAEFIFSIIKVVAVIGFVILGTILAADPDGKQGLYWRDPGAFHNGFKGLCSTFVTASFAYAGTELVGLAAAETQNPRATLPTAIKQVFWRIALFYILALTLVGLLVPYNDPRLLGASSGDTKASPFVIAIQDAGIDVLPSIFNVVILLAVLSVGNASVYGSSRTLAALAEQRQAPQFLAYIDRKGRPLVCIGIASVLGFLAFFAGSRYQADAFSWLLAISGLSSIFTWGSICLAHIRFRRAWRVQGHELSELAFRSQPGLVGSWLGFILNCLVLVAQFWTGFSPIGYADMTAAQQTQNFFNAYLAAPIVIACYVPYKLYFRTRIARSRDMDLDTGVREIDLPALVDEERRLAAKWPRWKKVYKFFC